MKIKLVTILNNRVVQYILYLFGYICTTPIKKSRGRCSRLQPNKNRYLCRIVLLRGGNLHLFINRDHCRAHILKGGGKMYKNEMNNGVMRVFKVKEIEKYGENKKSVVL